MSLTLAQQQTLGALLDCLIPADDFPSAQDAGVVDYVLRELPAGLAADAAFIADGLDRLAALALAKYGHPFTELTAPRQTELFAEVEHGRTALPWEKAPHWASLLIRIAMEGFYADPASGGNRAAASWRMIGYDERMPPPAVNPPRLMARPDSANLDSKPPAEADVVVIGAGAGGGIVAALAAEAGKHVVILERGDDLGFDDVGRSHIRNHRLALYGHNTGPELDGNPRVAVDRQGRARTVRPNDGDYHNNAMTVGGGTRVYGAQAWRYCSEDFRMASVYGTPAGSSLADWPISYEDLAPAYRQAEQEIGVAGDRSGHVRASASDEPYPMPAVPGNVQRQVLTAGAQRLGWHTGPVPLLINTIERHGRPACCQCGNCVGFACPNDAKSGTHNTMLPRALATGRCRLVTGAQAERIETDSAGRATGVWFWQKTPSGPKRHFVRAKIVVSSAGAIESARLLLNSPGTAHPRGLGNASGHVGRHLQGHYYPGTFAQFAQTMHDPRGPGVTIATCDFNHGNAGIIGGGMLANEFITIPVIFRRSYQDPRVPQWGAGNKQWMRENYRRVIKITGPVQEIPSPDSRVTLDSDVRDRFGMPVARLSGAAHPETIRAAEFMLARAIEWAQASGATTQWNRPVMNFLSAGQHQAGTCRMSAAAEHGVTDKWGRVWGAENVYVADGSLHVNNGGFNPVLTIMALAFRVGGHIARL